MVQPIPQFVGGALAIEHKPLDCRAIALVDTVLREDCRKALAGHVNLLLHCCCSSVVRVETCDHIASIPFRPAHIKRFSSKPAGFQKSASILAPDCAERGFCAQLLCPLAGRRARKSWRLGAPNRGENGGRENGRGIFQANGAASLSLRIAALRGNSVGNL
jgi:hypothetical protein